jgi:hypothetical protein
MIMPTRSSPEVHEYNPWIDYDDDGIISYSDLFYFGKAWYTTGDPTKDVNMKRSYYSCQYYFSAIPIGGWVGCHNTTAGYDRVSLFIILWGMDATIEVWFGIEQTAFIVDTFTVKDLQTINKVYDVVGDRIILTIYNIDTNVGDVGVFMYITA